MPNLHHWDDVTDETASAAVRKKVISGNRATLVRVTIAAGTSADRHSHDFEQFVQVISGRGVLETEEGSQSFTAGHIFHFAPGTWHAARFDAETVLVETNLNG